MDIDAKSPVRSIVWTEPVSADERTSLRSLAAILCEFGIGVAIVNRADGPPGIVSERDIVAALGEGADPDVVWARDVMSEDLIAVDPDARIFDVALRMSDENLRHLAVVEGDEVVGIVSIKDVVRVVTEDLLEAWG